MDVGVGEGVGLDKDRRRCRRRRIACIVHERGERAYPRLHFDFRSPSGLETRQERTGRRDWVL